MIRKVGKYEIIVSESHVTIDNYWHTTFSVSQGDQLLTIQYPSYELAMALANSENEEYIDYYLSKYRSEVHNWLNRIDAFLGIN